MSISENNKVVKAQNGQNTPIPPELISWDEPLYTESSVELNSLKSKILPYILTLVGILSGGSFFFLGRMSAPKEIQDPLSVSYQDYTVGESQVANAVSLLAKDSKTTMPKPQVTQKVVPTPKTSGEVVGSKTGKKYYFPWCGTVKRIKPENQVHFASIELAKQAGFTPGGNCKGIY